MKLSEIIKQVNRDTDEDYDNGDIIDWVNRALDDLTSVAKMQAYKSYPDDQLNSYDIPVDLHDVGFVMVGDNVLSRISVRDKNRPGYKMWAGKLSLQNISGTIDLYYYRKLKHMTPLDIDNEPDLEPEYHDLLILYAIGKMQFAEEDYDDRPNSLQDYERRKRQYELYRSKLQETNDTIGVG